jgi:uncharacterized protein (DUF4415 family)
MRKPLTNKAGEVRELTKKDFKAMKPIKEVLPELANIIPKRKRGERGPQKQPKKVLKTMRYSPEVIQYFEATGQDWQTRINKVLIDYIKKHPRNDPHKKHLKHTKHSGA